MRDTRLSSGFVNQLNARMKQVLENKGLRNSVVINPTFPSERELKVTLLSKSLKDFQRLALISWWLPEEIAYDIREYILEEKNRFNLEDRTLLELFLNSKAESILFLIETSLWHTRDFFGNFLEGMDYMLEKLLKIKLVKPNKVTKPQRKRGYHDHGTLKPLHCWKPSSDWSLTELQNSIENSRASQIDTLNFLKGLIR